MRAEGTDAVAAENQNVQRAVQNQQAVRGGAAALPSGVNAQVDAQIAANASQAGNKAQQDVTIENANLENQNQQNAIKEEMGVAGLENPEGIAGEENQGAGVVSNLSQAVTAANGPGIGSILGGIAGAAIGVAPGIIDANPNGIFGK